MIDIHRSLDDALNGAGGLAGGGDLGYAAVIGRLGVPICIVQALGQRGGLRFAFGQFGFQSVNAPRLKSGKDRRDAQGGEKGADHLAHAMACASTSSRRRIHPRPKVLKVGRDR